MKTGQVEIVMRKGSIELRYGQNLAGRLQKHSTHVGLVTWQEDGTLDNNSRCDGLSSWGARSRR